jgi:hypothetical protein
MKKRFASKPVDVGHGYQVEFTFRRGEILCEWAPNVPSASTPAAVLDRYRVAMDTFIAARLLRVTGRIGLVTTEVR